MEERIKQIRQRMQWTQTDFASRLGVTRDVVASWENGRVKPPEVVIRLICREYGIHYNWLKNGEEPMCAPPNSMMTIKLEQILDGDDEFPKAVFRELLDLPVEGWEKISAMVDRLYRAGHPQG